MSPLLSIVIPSFNRPAATAGLVDALGAQIRAAAEPSAVEILVVDDGSDPPLALAPAPGLALLRHARNRGAPAARKTGFAASAGGFIHFHDSDDGAPAPWLDAVLAALASEAPDLLVTARRVRRDGAERRVAPVFLASAADDPLRVKHYLRFENCVGPLGGVTFSRQSAERLSFPDLPSCQDWHMVFEALWARARIRVREDVAFAQDQDGSDRISGNPAAKRAGLAAALALMNPNPAARRLALAAALRHAATPRRLDARTLRAAALFFARRPVLSRRVFGRF